VGHTSGFTAATGCPRWGHHPSWGHHSPTSQKVPAGVILRTRRAAKRNVFIRVVELRLDRDLLPELSAPEIGGLVVEVGEVVHADASLTRRRARWPTWTSGGATTSTAPGGVTPQASLQFCLPQVGHTSGFTAPARCPRWGHHSEARGVPHPPPCSGFRLHRITNSPRIDTYIPRASHGTAGRA
jgi:hypothetical protein